jgi:hypothetical protein
MSRKISIIVDEGQTISIKGAAPGLQSAAAKAVEVSTDVLKTNLNERLKDLSAILSELPAEVGGYEPAEISVSLGVTTAGEVSLLSILKGSVGVTGAFVIKLTRAPKA